MQSGDNTPLANTGQVGAWRFITGMETQSEWVYISSHVRHVWDASMSHAGVTASRKGWSDGNTPDCRQVDFTLTVETSEVLLDAWGAGLWRCRGGLLMRRAVGGGLWLRCTAWRFGDQRFLIGRVILRRSQNELEAFSRLGPRAEHWHFGSGGVLSGRWQRWLFRIYLGGRLRGLSVQSFDSRGAADLQAVILIAFRCSRSCWRGMFARMRGLCRGNLLLGWRGITARGRFLSFHGHRYCLGINPPQQQQYP